MRLGKTWEDMVLDRLTNLYLEALEKKKTFRARKHLIKSIELLHVAWTAKSGRNVRSNRGDRKRHFHFFIHLMNKKDNGGPSEPIKD